IEDALFKFRERFTLPLVRLLSSYQVNIPMNVLVETSLHQKGLAPVTYFNDLPLATEKDIYFAGDQHTGHYLGIATLAEPKFVCGIHWPAGTELSFFDPVPTGRYGQIDTAIPGADMIIEGKKRPMGHKIFFDTDGHAVEKPLEVENRYD